MIIKYIQENWDKCVREIREDNDTLIGLPYPYTVPAIGLFEEIYYWDTYFTNKGLELSCRHELAKNNTDNMLFLVDRYGYMPNGNRTYYLKSSQPPFLSIMVRDVYEHYKDKFWLKNAYTALEKEYNFWMTQRGNKVGLNCYGGTLDDALEKHMAGAWTERAGFTPKDDYRLVAKHAVLSCESGWDFNPRWGVEGYNYAPVDLNSLLYMHETNMAYFAGEVGNGCSQMWLDRANARKAVMLSSMENADGVLTDYNFEKDVTSPIFSAASFFPLFAGLAESKHAEALVKNLHRLEARYGILTCEENDTEGVYQWDYPNGWACLQYVAIFGLDRYGYKNEALRVAEKYTALVEKVFKENGKLWEKYNVVEGNINVVNEYEMPEMMGWSAGVYLAAKEYVKKNKA